MTGFVLSPAAQADLDGIWDYTAARWNADQADRYINGIRDACYDLAAGKRVSRPVDVREGYRKLLVGSHTLFFKPDAAGLIVIVRVLHQRMDVSKHL